MLRDDADVGLFSDAPGTELAFTDVVVVVMMVVTKEALVVDGNGVYPFDVKLSKGGRGFDVDAIGIIGVCIQSPTSTSQTHLLHRKPGSDVGLYTACYETTQV